MRILYVRLGAMVAKTVALHPTPWPTMDWLARGNPSGITRRLGRDRRGLACPQCQHSEG
jgi:hypothetical protein